MLVENSFDLWQKDSFFSAAEEVQHSADIMESAYRTWLRARREGLMPQHVDELERELQMSLGTAKWQLEEFEKAVRLSYRSQGDDITATRHKQFVSVIGDQITRAEATLKESLNIDGKKPFRWVNLDEEECDDLARFLSGTPQMVQIENLKLGSSISSAFSKNGNSKDNRSFDSEVTSTTQISTQENILEIIVEDANCCIELEERKPSNERDDVTSSRRTWNSPDRSTLEIFVDGDDLQNNVLTEATPKEKGSKPFFGSLRCDEHHFLNRSQLKIITWINQHFRGIRRSPRQRLVSPMLAVRSIRFTFVLMLTIFLFVPFLLYTN